MILYAFAAELTEAIGDEALRQQVLARIGQRLPGGKHDIFCRTGTRDFPLLSREVNGQPLVYLDSAASAQKPEAVIRAEAEFYRHGYAGASRYPYPERRGDGADGTGAPAGGGSSTPARRKSWCSCAAPPKGSTWWPTAGERQRRRRR
jgi:hypothetical protein